MHVRFKAYVLFICERELTQNKRPIDKETIKNNEQESNRTTRVAEMKATVNLFFIVHADGQSNIA